MINTAPAVVIRAELNGLGVVRSLVRAAVPTIVLDTTRWLPAMWSRSCRTHVVDRLHGQSFVDQLLELQKKLNGQPVLIATDEMAADTVSEHRDQLLKAYRFHLPPRHMVRTLRNRARFFELAEGHGLPVPRTMILRPDMPLEALARLSFPVIVKPADRQAVVPAGTEVLYPIVTLKGAQPLCRRLMDSAGELIVQEWIDGPDSNICFALFHCGREPDSFKLFTGRKLASRPPRIGHTALCLAAPEVMNDLEPLVRKYLEVTEFEGLGSLTFKWDLRLRRYVIVGRAVGRTDRHEEIAALCGVNLPLAAYRHELGLQPILQKEIDRTAAWRESALLGNGLPALSPSMRIYDGYWRSNDPMPGIFFYARTALEWVNRKIVKPIIRRLKRSQMHAAVERAYRYLLKPILEKGKPSAP